MIYLTGDTHGVFDRVEDFCTAADTVKDDILIILGDAGINYFGESEDRPTKKELAALPITLFCIHGNHEMRPDTIKSYKEIKWRGGTVYAEDEFPNLLFAKDGEVYELEGSLGTRRCIAIGGAYSVDKYYRIPDGEWWEDEQPSDEIKERVQRRLEKENWRVDVVLSHTCPMKYIPREEFLSFIDQSTVDNSTEEWLDKIEDALTYERWYCGHYHVGKADGRVRFMFEEIRELL
jgi:3-oxoacid CoA-transferase subunit A